MSGTGIVIGNFVGGATGGGAGSSTPPITPGFNPLIFRIDTNYIVGSNDYTLGVDGRGTYDFTVNWGDGQSDVITSPTQPEITHSYSGASPRTISITPNQAYSVDHWSFGRRSSSIASAALTDIFSFGDVYFYANEDIFYSCENFNTVANRAGVPTFQNTVIIDRFFFRNDSLGTTTEPDFSGWGTFTGTGLQFMRGANVDPFSSSRVNVNFSFTPTSLQESFFNQILFNSPLSNWTVSSCNNFNQAFAFAKAFNRPLNWTFSTDVSVDISAVEMFKDALAFNQDISSWNTSRFTDTSSMFESGTLSVFNQDISSWNTDSITNASSMFKGASAFTSDLSNWFSSGSLVNAASFTGGINNIFDGATSFDGDVDGWDTSNLTCLISSFRDTTSFNKSLSTWDVGNVLFFVDCFKDAKLFTGLGLPGWDTSSAVSFSGMFNGASAFNQDLSSWDISSLTSASDMLTGTAISQSNWDSLLIGWATQAPNIQNNVTLSDIPVLHSAGKPKDSYDRLTSAPYNWTITDLGGAAPPPSFSFTIDTTSTETGSSAANQYRLPLMSTGTYDFYVNWGDGTLGDQITTWNQSEATHTYASSGTYTISIQAVSLSGGTPSIDHISWASQDGTTLSTANDRLKVQDITAWGNAVIYLNEYVFSTCNNLDITTTVEPTFGSRVLRSDTFNDCSSFAGDISSWGTQAPITGSASIFYQNGGQNPNVNFDAQLTGSLFAAFLGASNFNSSLSNWDVSSVTSLSIAFRNASSFNQNISTWDTSSVTSLSSTFRDAAAFDQDLSSWDVGSVTTASDMFTNSGLSAANWDALLIGWAAQGTGVGSLRANVTLSNINQYHGTVDAAATAAYNKLTAAPYNWNIVDLGELPTSAFDFDIDTTQIQLPGSSANDQYRLPLMSTGTYNFTVNWGDGQSNSITTWNQSEATHTYASSGIYSISITGTIDHVSWISQDGTTVTQANDRKKVKDITDWGSAVIYLNELVFLDCENMNITTTAAPTFGSKVMGDDQFADCESFTGDISAWGTVASPITGSVNSFLASAGNANPNVNFVYQRTSSSLFRAFYLASNFNKPLDNWDVAGSGGNCTDAFYFCLSFNQDISGWDMSGANSMTRMFSAATVFNQNISTWDVSGVGSFNSMFKSATSFNQPIGSWTTTSLDDLRGTFDTASSFNQDLSNWDTSSVDDMQSTFEDATAFNQDLSSWDVSSLTIAINMFTNSGLSAENWDKLLIGWAAQGTGAGSLQANVTLSNINQQHGSVDSAAIAAYNKLVAAPYSWTIIDLGAAVVGNLLLDTSYGSGAEAAYSVRKLRTAYTGPAIQVQDTAGGAVQDIYFDANDNLDEAAIFQYAGSNTVLVSKWYDQSGNGNDAEQTSSGSRPTIYTGGALVKENGNVAMSMDYHFLMSSTILTNTFSVFAVGKSDGDSYFMNKSGANKQIRINEGDQYLMTVYPSTKRSYLGKNHNQQLAEYIGNSTSLNFFQNGTNAGTASSHTINQNVIGGFSNNTQPTTMNYQELIVYNSDKSGTAQTSIEENIGDYYTQNTPLLDTYTGAEAAYSLRLLRTAYTGSAIQVQRADNVGGTTDIGFNCFGELDTVSLVAAAAGNSMAVTKWYDQSGNSNDAEQISSGARPKIYDGTTGVVTDANEKPALYFDGLDVLTTSGTTVSVGSQRNDFAVFNLDVWPGAILGMDGVNGGGRFAQNMRPYTTGGMGTLGFKTSSTAVGIEGATAINTGQQYLFSAELDGTDLNVYLDGSLDGTTTQSIQRTGNTNLVIGSDYLTNTNRPTGLIQEVITYQQNKSSVRTDIEDNINTFYDIYTEPVAPLLLNNYPGAAAAYSLRRINSSYQGSAVLVQTANNTKQPVYIGFDSNNDLDTVSLAAYGGSEEVVVAGWLDQSGNGKDAIQNSSGSRPVIYRDSTATTPGVVTENGKLALDFDGSNDYLSANTVASNFTGLSKPLSSFVISQSTATALKPVYAFGNSSTNNSIRYFGTSPAGNNQCGFQERDDDGSPNVFIAGGSMTVQNLGTIITNGDNNRTIYVDGTSEENSTADVDTITLNQFAIGALDRTSVSNYWDGIVQEIVLYDSDKSSDRTDIEDNIGGYYDIPLAGLLDENPGAAAAYSLRRLSSTYTGSAIQVQRADNVGGVTDIGFDSYGELDTTALTTAAQGNDMVVAKWYDQSGNSNDAEQPSSGSRPKIYDGQNGVVDENGKPAIQLDGSDDNFEFTTTSTITTKFVVQKTNDTNAVLFSSTAVGSRWNFILQQGNNNKDLSDWGGTGSFGYKNGAVVAIQNVNTRDDLYNSLADNVQNLTSWIGLSAPSDTYYFGRYYNVGLDYSGKVQEIILYNTNQSGSRTDIEDNIGGYYDIPLVGLLDENPGAAAAYSLRRLSSTYTGSAIQVQRADNVGVTTDIGFDSYGELDTRALTTAAQGNDMAVTKWYDQSGNSNDAEQTSSGARPKIYDASTGVVTENGKPALDVITSQGGLSLNYSRTVTAQSHFVVAEVQQVNSARLITQFLAGSTFDYNPVGSYIPMIYYNDLGSYADGYKSMQAASAGQHGISSIHTGSSITNYVDGNAATSASHTLSSTAFASYHIKAGWSQVMTGTVQEVILFDSNESNKRTDIEDNINAFYDIY